MQAERGVPELYSGWEIALAKHKNVILYGKMAATCIIVTRWQ